MVATSSPRPRPRRLPIAMGQARTRAFCTAMAAAPLDAVAFDTLNQESQPLLLVNERAAGLRCVHFPVNFTPSLCFSDNVSVAQTSIKLTANFRADLSPTAASKCSKSSSARSPSVYGGARISARSLGVRRTTSVSQSPRWCSDSNSRSAH